MDRLTIWHNNGVRVKASANACFNECREEEAMHCFWCSAIWDIIQRLAEYEDSGLSPAEISEISNLKKSQPSKLYEDGQDSADDL